MSRRIPTVPARVKNGKVPTAGLQKAVPLVYRGRTVGRVEKSGEVVFPKRKNTWREYAEAGRIEEAIEVIGVNKVMDGARVIAVVVPTPKKRRS